MNSVEFPDSWVKTKCFRCGQYRSKRNMARHQKKQNCAAAVAAQISGDLAGTEQGDVMPQRSRSVSRGEELAAIAETVVQKPVIQMSAGQGLLCAPQVGQGPLCASQLGSNPLTLQNVSFPVALQPQNGEFDALMLLHGTQLVGQDLFTTMPAAVTPIQSVAPAVNVKVGEQPPFSAQQKTVFVNPSNDSELGRSPVIELHAASDVKSDGGRATSTVTVSTVGGTKVSAVATVRETANDSLQTKSKKHRATSSTAQLSTGGRVRDGRKRTKSRSKSPRQRQSRGRQNFVYRREQKSYTVDADDYRCCHDFMLRRRN